MVDVAKAGIPTTKVNGQDRIQEKIGRRGGEGGGREKEEVHVFAVIVAV